MKLDYDLIKDILEKIESGDGFTPHVISANSYKDDETKFKEEYLKLAYHYKLLISEGLIDAKILDAHFLGAPIPIEIRCTSLTMQGHKVLEGIRNESLWNKIKGTAKAMGIEGLKQIPSLAIQILKG